MSTKQAIPLRLLNRPAQSSLTLAMQSFLLSREAMRCTEATLIWYRKYGTALVTYLSDQDVQNIEAVTPTHVRGYLVHLQRRGLADRTIHHHASAARAFFNYLVAEDIIRSTPMRNVKMPRLDNSILPAFTLEDVQKLLAACTGTRNKAMVLSLLDTGCRASEFVALNVGDVNIGTGAVSVIQGKGRKDRLTYLGAKARKAMVKYLLERGKADPSEPLWLSENTGERLTHHGLRLMLERLGERTSVEHCHPHTFRRTCALWSLRAGMNIYALQQIMGHSDLTILRRYLSLVEEDLADAHRKHGAVDNML